jgi:hypothetical protein
MAGDVKTNLGLAIRTLLKPLVKLLISQGITHGDFSEAAKDVYVEVALRHFTEKNKINKSKVAILTGLTRKEVANVIERAMRPDLPSREFSRPSRVLSGWHTDPDYTGPYGFPLEIPYDSPDGEGNPPSFVHLVRTYSGDMAPKGMLEELTRVGAVVIEDGGQIKVVRRDFEPQSLSPELIQRFGDVGFNVISTVASNVEKEGSGTGPFDRVVFSDHKLTREELKKFDAYLKKNLQEVLETIDIWLSMNIANKSAGQPDEETFDTGVAMIQYIDWKPEDKTTLHQFLSQFADSDEENSKENI